MIFFLMTFSKLDWFDAADQTRPFKVPPFRTDRAEDVVDPLWVHGVGPGTELNGYNSEFSRLENIEY